MGGYTAYVVPPEEPEEEEHGGRKGDVYQVAPRKIFIKPDLSEPSLRLADIQPKEAKEILSEATEVTIDGDTYDVISGPPITPKQALEMLPPHHLERKIAAVREELGVTKKKAVSALKLRAKKELAAAEVLKAEMVKDDEELALIIIMSEV